jgi:hypothetical protein
MPQSHRALRVLKQGWLLPNKLRLRERWSLLAAAAGMLTGHTWDTEQAKKCEKEEKSEKGKVKKAIEKGNIEGARIYAQNAIRKKTEQLNYLKVSTLPLHRWPMTVRDQRKVQANKEALVCVGAQCALVYEGRDTHGGRGWGLRTLALSASSRVTDSPATVFSPWWASTARLSARCSGESAGDASENAAHQQEHGRNRQELGESPHLKQPGAGGWPLPS